jgi:hypothetical protein
MYTYWKADWLKGRRAPQQIAPRLSLFDWKLTEMPEIFENPSIFKTLTLG